MRLKFLRLDWDNEVEVIKQGAALGVYFVINMIIIVALVALTLILNTIMRIPEILLVLSGVSILFSIVCYRLCMVKDGS
jgi:ABC-2 type transport system permease protein